MNKRNIFLKAGIALVPIFSFFISSCKKEYPDYPYNDITSFEVEIDEENMLKAALEGGEIILYWPPFQSIPDSVSPQISVSERATIHPASGEKIPFVDGFIYTVTAQDGSVRSFQLKISANTPDPGFYFNSPATDGVYTVRYDQDFVQVRGNYIIPDTTKTKVYFSNPKAGEINMTPFINSLSQIRVAFHIHPSVDTGLYNIRVVSGKFSFEPEEKLYVYYQEPGINWPYTTELKVGEAVTFNTKAGVYPEGPTRIDRIRLRSATDGSLHELELILVEEGIITIKVPGSFPEDIYNGIELRSPAFPNGFIQNIPNLRRRIVVSK